MSTSVSRLAADTGLTVDQVLEICRRAGVSAWGPTTILLEGDLRALQPHLAGAVPRPEAFATPPAPGQGVPPTGQPLPPPGGAMPPPGQAFGAPPPPPGGYGAPPTAYGAVPPPGYVQPGYAMPGMPPQKGPSRAKTALIAVGIVAAGIVGLGIIGALAGDPDDDASDSVLDDLPNIPDILDVPGQELPDFVVGDCYDDHSDVPDVTGTSMVEAQVEKVPCSAPHDAEVYLVFDHPAPPDATYPGDGAIFDAAVDGCLPPFEAFVGIPYEQSSLDVYFLTPSEQGFNRLDDRQMVCSVVNLDGSPMPGGTARGSRR